MFKIVNEFYVICLVIKVISEYAVYPKDSLCLPSSKFNIYFVPANYSHNLYGAIFVSKRRKMAQVCHLWQP